MTHWLEVAALFVFIVGFPPLFIVWVFAALEWYDHKLSRRKADLLVQHVGGERAMNQCT